MTRSYQQQLQFRTGGRGSVNITAEVSAVAAESGIDSGLCHVFLRHTSASLMLCENADPAVRADLDAFMLRLVPDGDALFSHVDEGPDDMAAHVRAVLSGMELTLPVTGGRLGLGTWQGVYLWEHRHHPHLRRVTVTVQG